MAVAAIVASVSMAMALHPGESQGAPPVGAVSDGRPHSTARPFAIRRLAYDPPEHEGASSLEGERLAQAQPHVPVALYGGPPPSTPVPAYGIAPPPDFDVHFRSLAEIVTNATVVHVTAHRGGHEHATDLTQPARLAAVVAALGGRQMFAHEVPRCTAGTRLEFRDSAHQVLATVGLCDDAGAAPGDRNRARVDLPDGAAHGLNVHDLAALLTALRPEGGPVGAASH